MPDFQGSSSFVLRPGANRVPLSFAFTPATASNTNDGSIPYGTTISGASISVYDQDGTDRTAMTVNPNTIQIVGTVVSATFKHPNTGEASPLAMRGIQTYTAVVTLTLSNGSIIPYECRRVLVDARSG